MERESVGMIRYIGLNHEKRRVVLIEYSIKIHLNKEIKAKIN